MGNDVAHQDSNLSDIADTVRRRWRLIAVAALSLFLGAAVYAERQPLEYDASAIVAVTPRPGQPSAELVRVGTPRYASFITAPATIRRVAARVRQSDGQLQQRVSATITPDSGNITITVRHRDRRWAVDIANLLTAEIRRASNGDRLLRVELVAPPVLPESPSAPPRRLIKVAALIVGVLLGVGLATLADGIQGRPARWRSGTPMPSTRAPRRPGRLDLAGLTAPELPVLGGYPVVGELPWSPALAKSVSGALAEPAIAEAAAVLQANLARELGGDLRGMIVVTSPTANQGKTTVARLLSARLIRSSSRILLVDAHKEHPEILRALREGRNGGHGTTPADEAAAEGDTGNWIKDLWTLDDGLWVLRASRGPTAAALSGGQMVEVIDEAREMFDAVIVDSPPLLHHEESEASVSRKLTPLADAVLFVVSPDSTVEALHRSIQALRDVSAPFVGVVLSRGAGHDRRRRVVERAPAGVGNAEGGRR
jgi:Mrp family chromosome partitioning ATPase/capsular polysaccharide biosynthesis protein